MAQSVALYLRVSTTRQAEQDLSIPDQLKQLTDYCNGKGWQVVAEYVEPGASATDDKRPEFQRMLDAAAATNRPFSVIVVHSFSRFFRDAYEFEFHRRKLEKNGVSIVSMTQELGDDPMDNMVRQILNVFDEYQSKENAKHTLRAMKENARQGFWNGSMPPLGYQVVDAEKRGDKVKRKLEIKESEAKIVRLIFDTYSGSKTGQPIGVKATTTWLNDEGYRTRDGHPFSIGYIHRILTSETNAGTHWFNKKDSKTGRKKPRSEWITMACPAIISQEKFDAVQAQLSSRQPSKVAPRLLSSPTLLSGIAKCSDCGSAMMLRTGTGKMGKIYKYYTCSEAALKGKTACKGQSIPMDQLDGVVIGQITERIFTPVHVTALLKQMQEMEKTSAKDAAGMVRRLQKEIEDANKRIDRIYQAVENGIELDETLKERLSGHKMRKDSLVREKALTQNPSGIPKQLMKPKHVNAFCESFKHSVQNADKSVQKRLLGMFVDDVIVDKENGEITITGQNQAVLAALTAKGGTTPNGVRSFVREWCPRRDSNSRPPD